MNQVEIAIVGAGLAGLTCAQILRQAGYQVVVLEKARGVGGRLATRRLQGTRADHGTCYLSPKAEPFQAYVDYLVAEDVAQVWTTTVHELLADGQLQTPIAQAPRYVAPDGMNAIAKALTPGLDVRLSQRVVELQPTPQQTWELTVTASPIGTPPTETQTWNAQAVVLTPPAPQTVELLASLVPSVVPPTVLDQLQTVEFMPCIAVMAGYDGARSQAWQQQFPGVKAIVAQHPDLGWIGLDSSKRHQADRPVVVVQSTAAFAQAHLDTVDLAPMGEQLLATAGKLLCDWLATPDWMQVHRWRYALVTRPLAQLVLDCETPLPLVCAGDWCGGMRAESAFLSGMEAATRLNAKLHNRPLRSPKFWPL